MILDNRENLQKCHDYVKALEEERLKIELLKHELPLSLELVTQAIDTYKQPSSSAATTTTTTDCINGQSDCSEQTTTHDLAFEFIPIKRSSEDDDNDEQESQDNSTQFNNKNDIENSSSGKKSDWLRSVKLWNQSSDPTTTDQESNEMKKVGVVDLKRNGGVFLPFKKEKLVAGVTDTTTTTTDCVNGQSDCSEQTTSHDLAFEFIPIKRSSEEDDDNDEQESQDNSTQFNNKNDIENSSSGKKSDWLKSVKLWNQSSDPTTTDQESNEMTKVGVVDLKRNGGAFLPFKKEKLVAGVTDTTTPAVAHQAVSVCSTATEDGDGAPGMGKEGGGSKKSRRCWTPELQRKFVEAVKQLGGSDVAKPKQIRELMKVDGLTNDEVKSHLQKYRLNKIGSSLRRQPATPSAGGGRRNMDASAGLRKDDDCGDSPCSGSDFTTERKPI